MMTTIVGTAGRDVLVKSITLTASGILKGVTYLLGSTSQTYGVREIKATLQEEDVEAEIKIIQALSHDIQVADDSTEAIQVSLHGVMEVLQAIELELACINNKVENAEKPYWYFWKRGGNFKDNVLNIQLLMKRFRTRVHILFELMKIYQH